MGGNASSRSSTHAYRASQRSQRARNAADQSTAQRAGNPNGYDIRQGKRWPL